jgi:hypothetical protein
MASYEIVFGEIGFNILRDGKISRINIATRELARKQLAADQKHDQLLVSARERVHHLFTGLKEDFGITQYELEQILELEGFKHEQT